MKKVKLGDIATTITKGTTPTTIGFNFVDDGINFVKIESISDDGNFLKEKFGHIEECCNKKMQRSQLQENDILFSIAGAIGRVAIVNKEILPANTNQALAIIRIANGMVFYPYLLYVLKSSFVYEQFEKKKQGVAQLNLSLKDVSDLEIPLPSLEEQKEIADRLDKVSSLIEKRKIQLEKLDQLIKSRFIEMFGNIDACKKKLELQDICVKITDGSHNPPAGVEKSENYMISSQNIHDNIIDYKDVRYLNDSDFENENKRTTVTPGDVLLTIVGAIGRSAVVKDDLNITCQRSVCVIHPNRDKINSIFLKYMLDSISDKIINEARGAAQKGIYLNQVKKLQIICPSLDLQTQFADFVEQTDKSKLAIQKSIDKLETLKKSLMQQYFG